MSIKPTQGPISLVGILRPTPGIFGWQKFTEQKIILIWLLSQETPEGFD